jgi:hypothetical protein
MAATAASVREIPTSTITYDVTVAAAPAATLTTIAIFSAAMSIAEASTWSPANTRICCAAKPEDVPSKVVVTAPAAAPIPYVATRVVVAVMAPVCFKAV